MRFPRGTPCHAIAPKEFRRVPNITGSVELDRVISASNNPDMARRLTFYAGDSRGFSGPDNFSYGPRTNYDGYSGYSGDE
jgi:hypothetical protein